MSGTLPEPTDLLARRRRDAMLMATLSLMVILHRRWWGEPLLVVGSEAVSVLGLFGIGLLLQTWRPLAQRFSPAKVKLLSLSLAGIALLVPTLSRYISFRVGSYSAAWEMVMLTTLGIASIALVFCSRDFRHTALSVVCSGFLVLFATSISDSHSALYFAILWLLICLYWMVANHWERLEVHLAQTIRHDRSLRLGTTAMGAMICVLAGIAIWGREPATRLIQWGIMPTSGGQQWNDPSARSGVGDGDAVVAAKEHAASFGPVDSELFLQSDLPSLFDMFDDTLGEITLKKRSEKAMALPNQTPVGEEQKFAQSQQGNAAFSTSREAAKVNRKLKDKNSAAVLHWVGPSGISLAMERFDRFDGIDWTKSVAPPPGNHYPSTDLIRKQWHNSKDKQEVWYFRDRATNSPLLAGVQSNAVKFINLKSDRIPAPAETEGVHVSDIDRDDFFAFTSDSSWIMPDRETVPSLTIVCLVRREIDGDVLINATFPESQHISATLCSLEKETDGIRLAHTIASEWTKELPRGWSQVCRTVERLRSDFDFDRSESLDDSDPLLDFLINKRGGDHMFSTAAIVMLDSLGYRARLATGFYCDSSKVDAFAGHTEIGIDDAHVWAEVDAGDGVWIPIEPTPGYEQPRFFRTLWNRAIAFVWHMLPWFGGGLVVCTMLWLSRAWWGEAVCKVIWWLSRPLGDRARLSVLIRVLETRSRLANAKRPIGVPQRKWFTDFASESDDLTSRAARNFFDAADAIYFSPSASLNRNWTEDANQVAQQLTVRKMMVRRSEWMSQQI